MADVLDADAVDRQTACVGPALHIFDLSDGRPRHLCGNRWSHGFKPTSMSDRPLMHGTLGAGFEGSSPHFEVDSSPERWVASGLARVQPPPAERIRSWDCVAHQRSTLAVRPAR